MFVDVGENVGGEELESQVPVGEDEVAGVSVDELEGVDDETSMCEAEDDLDEEMAPE